MEEFTVTEKSGRLDQYIMNQTGFSRTKVQKLIKAGAVIVNGKPSKNSYQVEVGDQIVVQAVEEEEMSHEPENIPLDIKY